MMSNSFLVSSERRRAFATLEYVMLVIILAAGLYTFRNYIQRGFQGQYRRAGESFGFLRQYNPSASRDCTSNNGTWYEQGCFNNQVVSLRCGQKSPSVVNGQTGSPYDDCINQARSACTAGCNF